MFQTSGNSQPDLKFLVQTKDKQKTYGVEIVHSVLKVAHQTVNIADGGVGGRILRD